MHQNTSIRGLYIHVPFCPVVCSYCDFAVMKAPQRLHGRWLDAVTKEITIRSNGNTHFDTLYIGGGTPSILSVTAIDSLFEVVFNRCDLKDVKEITFEANPENISSDLLKCLKNNGVTRISLGVQTFDDSILKTLKRQHAAKDSLKALELIKSFSFEISTDFMFGLPNQTTQSFLNDLEKIQILKPEHISFYGLTVEPYTLLSQQVKRKELYVSDLQYNEMYSNGVAYLASQGLDRYEVSNFSREGKEAIHNTLYWMHNEYLGVGPGAHSFMNNKRLHGARKFKPWESWALANASSAELHEELITGTTLFNEMVWLGLRTKYGIDCKTIFKATTFSIDSAQLLKWIDTGYLQELSENCYALVGDGWLFIDDITTDLMY